MKAILNMYGRADNEKEIYVGKGDRVKANTSEFGVTETKEYIIYEVNSIDMITVLNDDGELEIYAVDFFEKL